MDGESPVVGRFLKVLEPGFETALKIPPAFGRILNDTDLNSKTAVLKSCRGSWEVDVKKCDHGCLHFLGKSWKGYVSQHDLKEGDFIVFEHKGHLRFNTIIFDETYCEKNFATSEESSDQNYVMSLESSEDDDVEHVAGGSNQIVNSQFQMTLTTTNVPGYINVPAKFVRSNAIREDGTVMLRNDTGDSWLANLKFSDERSNDRGYMWSRVRIYGLSQFFKENMLKAGDTCVFELDHSSRNPKHLVMNVLFRRMQ